MEGTHHRQIPVFAIVALVVFALAVATVLPFVPAILWATVLSVLVAPLYVRWRNALSRLPFLAKSGRAETLASIGATLGAAVIIVLPFLFIGLGLYLEGQRLVDQIGDANGRVSTASVLRYVDDAVRPLAERVGAGRFSVTEYVGENRTQIVQSLRQPVTRFATQSGYTVLTLVVALLTMFFMLRDGARLRDPALDLIPLPRSKAVDLLSRLADTIRAVFVGTVLVAVIQGAIMGVTYRFLGVPNALLLGVFSVLLCIIPLLGAPVLYIPIGLLFLLQGDVVRALVVFGVGGLIVSQIDNVLKPYFIAGRANLHPMAVFFAILGGVLLIGPIGVMAGPMLLTIALAILETMRERREVAIGEIQPASD